MRRAKQLEQRLQKIRDRRSKPKKRVIDFPNLVAYKQPHKLSNKIDGMCVKRDVTTEHLWKRGRQETPETVKAINEKKKRIRPHYSKGNYSYSTDGDNTGPIRVHQKGG